MKKTDNKGFSLVELLVAFAIFTIVGVAVCAFINICSKNFAVSNTNVKLQYEQQLVVNRVRDAILETSRGISFNASEGKLIVFSDNADYRDYVNAKKAADPKYKVDGDANVPSPYYVSEFRYAADENGKGALYYGYSNSIAKDKTMADILSMSFSESVICDSISKFEVDLSKIDSSNEVLLTMTFKVGDKELTVNPVISLRNVISEVDAGDDLDDLYEKLEAEIYSAVAKVEIVRDDKIFGQSRTDTIEMVDVGSTVVDYDAIVTKKKTYKADINTEVTWSIDASTLTDTVTNCSPWLNINGATGVVTLATKDGKTPNDFIKGNAFVIVATSVEDPTKSARLRIEVKSGGVYPVSLSTSLTETKDIENGKLIINLNHSISYTGLIEDPITEAKVNPLTGEGAFTKVKYISCVDEEGNNPPKGAGFSSASKVDGKFIATKAMENHTYYVTVQVIQKNKDGQAVTEIVEINIPEGAVPNKVNVKKPVLNVSEPSLRGDVTTMSATWLFGVPDYKINENDDATTAYNYWYEWKITDNGNEGGKWNSTKITLEDGTVVNTTTEKTSFENNIFFSNGKPENEGWDAEFNKGKSVTTTKLQRTNMVYIRPYLEWKVAYTYKVELRVKISKGNDYESALYYKLPDKDTDKLEDMTTSNYEEAYVDSQVVTIDPVTLKLTPSKDAVFYDGSKNVLNSVFTSSTTVGRGKRPLDSWSYDQKQQAKDYYKLFTPSFEGLSVTIFNYRRNIYNADIYGDNAYDGKSGIQKALSYDRYGAVISSALQPYTTEANGVVYEKKNQTGFASGIRLLDNYDNKLYFYLKLTPDDWITTGKLYSGCKWVCLLKDSKGNEVTAKFVMPVKEDDAAAGEQTTDYVNYTIKNAYEGEY